MQRVIHRIEALRSAGIPVPPYPYVEPFPAAPGVQSAPSASDLQAKVDAFEVRVEAWRKEVIELHRLHFPEATSTVDLGSSSSNP